MSKYGKPVWQWILEAAQKLETKTFSPIEIIRKIQDQNPKIPSSTIRSYVMAMAPNHPSSKHHPSTRKLHGYFNYLGNGIFEIKKGNRITNEINKGTEKEKPIQRSFTDEISTLVEVSQRLSKFQATWVTFESFKDHVDQMKKYFSEFEEIWITGHFSYSFARELDGLCNKFPGCDLRILSIDPRGNKNNLRALTKLKANGAKVKIHPALHARIFIGYNGSTSSWETIIGSYDYNREGISGENINASIASRDICVIQEAREFFLDLWDSPEAHEDF